MGVKKKKPGGGGSSGLITRAPSFFKTMLGETRWSRKSFTIRAIRAIMSANKEKNNENGGRG